MRRRETKTCVFVGCCFFTTLLIYLFISLFIVLSSFWYLVHRGHTAIGVIVMVMITDAVICYYLVLYTKWLWIETEPILNGNDHTHTQDL